MTWSLMTDPDGSSTAPAVALSPHLRRLDNDWGTMWIDGYLTDADRFHLEDLAPASSPVGFHGSFAALFQHNQGFVAFGDDLAKRPIFVRRSPSGVEISSRAPSHDGPTGISLAALVERMIFGYPLTGSTYSEGITHVAPGSVLRYASSTGLTVLPAQERPTSSRTSKLNTRFAQHLPAGECDLVVLLSGGVDSSALLALTTETAQQTGQLVAAISYGEEVSNERARSVAEALRVPYRHVQISEQSFLSRLPDSVTAADSPWPSVALHETLLALPDGAAVLTGHLSEALLGADWFVGQARSFLATAVRRYLRAHQRLSALFPAAIEPSRLAIRELLRAAKCDEPGAIRRFHLERRLSHHSITAARCLSDSCGIDMRFPFGDPVLLATLAPSALRGPRPGLSELILERFPTSLAAEILMDNKRPSPAATNQVVKQVARTVASLRPDLLGHPISRLAEDISGEAWSCLDALSLELYRMKGGGRGAVDNALDVEVGEWAGVREALQEPWGSDRPARASIL